MCLIGPQRRMRQVKPSRPVLGVRLFDGTKKHPGPVYKQYDFSPTDWNMTNPPRVDDPADVRQGFWAFAPTTGWQKRVENLALEAVLVGVVELRGKVVVHRDGYRAQELRILRLWENPESKHTLTAVARFLVKAKKR